MPYTALIEVDAAVDAAVDADVDVDVISSGTAKRIGC
jgi:hypothetical protein